MAAENTNGWPPLEELKSDEAQLIRRALDSLGNQQIEMLGSIQGLGSKLHELVKESEQQIRAEQRTEFRGIRQQLGGISTALEAIDKRTFSIETATGQTRERVDSMQKVLHTIRVGSSLVPPGTVKIPSVPASIPPSSPTSTDRIDFERTPMGGIRLDEKAQAVLTQRLAKLEEERRVADARSEERAAIIATQKREAEEKRLADERAENARVERDLKKSQERRNWLAAIVAACVAGGGGLGWLVHELTRH